MSDLVHINAHPSGKLAVRFMPSVSMVDEFKRLVHHKDRQFVKGERLWTVPAYLLPHLEFCYGDRIRVEMDASVLAKAAQVKPPPDEINQRKRLTEPDYMPGPLAMAIAARAADRGPYTPFSHQVVMMDWHLSLRRMLNFSEMGTGKTFPVIWTAHHRLKTEAVRRGLVVSPLGVAGKWSRQYEEITGLKAPVLHGTKRKRLKLLAGIDSGYAIINYDGVRTILDDLLRWKPEDLILDEVHQVRNPETLRFRVLRPLSEQAIYVAGLTGSPVLRGLLDLYGQFALCDPEAVHQSFYVWRAKWFVNKPWPMQVRTRWGKMREVKIDNWKPKTGTKDAFRALLSKRRVRFLKRQCLDLPPVVRENIEVPLSKNKDLLRAYYEMREELRAELYGDAGTVRVLTRCAAAMKCLQLCGGFVLGKGRVPHAVGKINPKMRVLEDLLKSILSRNHKVVIWCHFRHENVAICKMARQEDWNPVSVMGGMKPSEIEKRVQAFENEPEVRVLVAQPKTGGIGIDLTAAAYSIRYSRSADREDFSQSEGRLLRSGSEKHKSITYIELLATLPEGKGETVDVVYDWLCKSSVDLNASVNADMAKRIAGPPPWAKKKEPDYGVPSETPDWVSGLKASAQ